MRYLSLFLCLLFLNETSLKTSRAESDKVSPSIRIEGRKNITINKPSVNLADLAHITSNSIQDDEAIIALQKLTIESSPAPGETITISASRVLERMKEYGVELSQVIYVLPRVTKVTRAYRLINQSEVEKAVKAALENYGREAVIKRINFNSEIKVPPDLQELRASLYQTQRPGLLGFHVKADLTDGQNVSFDVTAQIDEWSQIPVSGRYISRGETIGENDFVMARVNLTALPSDSIHTASEVIGKEVLHDIPYGESFRKNRLIIPAVISAGSKVFLIYKTGSLEATATGVALDSGILDQQIRVRNDHSKKVIIGRVLEEGKVGVNP